MSAAADLSRLTPADHAPADHAPADHAPADHTPAGHPRVKPERYGPDSGVIDPFSQLATLAARHSFIPINSAAFILQLMHPVIGDIVGRYSVATKDPWGRAIRSIDSVERWYFGGLAAIEEGHRLRAQHQPLQMVNGDGKHISALNPGAYAWVIGSAYVTYLDSAPYVLGRPLSRDEKVTGLADLHKIAKTVQVPDGIIPTDVDEYLEYYDDMVENTLVNHPMAAELIGGQLHRPDAPRIGSARGQKLVDRAFAPLARPIGSTTSALTLGVLRPQVRELLGVEWTDRDQLRFERVMKGIRIGERVLPDRITMNPLAFHARKHAVVLGRMKRRDLASFVDNVNDYTPCPYGGRGTAAPSSLGG